MSRREILMRQYLALVKSAVKWWKIWKRGGVDEGPRNCACCQEWFRQNMRCVGCPIFEAMGDGRCNGTPYEEWDVYMEETEEAREEWAIDNLDAEGEVDAMDWRVFDEKSRALAEEEYLFLKDLQREWKRKLQEALKQTV